MKDGGNGGSLKQGRVLEVDRGTGWRCLHVISIIRVDIIEGRFAPWCILGLCKVGFVSSNNGGFQASSDIDYFFVALESPFS